MSATLLHRTGPGTAVAILALALGVGMAAGPARAADPRLAARLDSTTAAVVTLVVDSAGARGLPTDPLVARALEGASRGADGSRIVAAVRGLAAAMDTSRNALGPRSTPSELVAGAAALAAGVGRDSIASLRAARGPESVVIPLVVMTDLVTRHVPVATASAAVLAATRARVADPELFRLRERIDRDIRTGTTPQNATILRTRSLVRSFEAPRATERGP